MSKLPDILGDRLANWAKRRVRSAFGVVAENASVDSAMAFSKVSGPGGCHVSVNENGNKLVDLFC